MTHFNRYVQASLFAKPTEYGKGTSRTVSIKSLDGRIDIMGFTTYLKPSGGAGTGVKGKYVLRWVIVDRWMPSPSGQKFTEAPIRPNGDKHTFDRKTAIEAAIRWLKTHPLDAPLPGSQKYET